MKGFLSSFKKCIEKNTNIHNDLSYCENLILDISKVVDKNNLCPTIFMKAVVYHRIVKTLSTSIK